MTPNQLKNTVSLANAVALIRKTVEKVGLEFIAPLPPAEQDEKLSKFLNQAAQKSIVQNPGE